MSTPNTVNKIVDTVSSLTSLAREIAPMFELAKNVIQPVPTRSEHKVPNPRKLTYEQQIQAAVKMSMLDTHYVAPEDIEVNRIIAREDEMKNMQARISREKENMIQRRYEEIRKKERIDEAKRALDALVRQRRDDELRAAQIREAQEDQLLMEQLNARIAARAANTNYNNNSTSR